MRSVIAALLLGAAFLGNAVADAAQADRAALLEGVSEIAAPGWPGCLSVYGDQAEVLIAGKNGKNQAPVVATAPLGEGRIVALGHNGYFAAEALQVGDTARLLLNAVRWSGRATKPTVGLQNLPDLAARLKRDGLTVKELSGAEWLKGLPECRVLVTAAMPGYDAATVKAVSEFVRGGGGLVTADTAWGWLQLNPGKSLTADHGGNKVLSPAGLVFADGGLDRTSGNGFATVPPPSSLCHAGTALAALEAQQQGTRQLTPEERAQAGFTVMQAARSVLPEDTLLRPRLLALRREQATEALPSKEKPLTLAQPLARLALTLELDELRALPADQVQAHPAAAAFPGAVPTGAPRVTQTLAINTVIPGWHSTGLYAAPGEVITVAVPAAAVGKGLGAQIGCHTDQLWPLDQWQRCPQIVRSFPLRQASTPAANAFGGPIYITVPEGCTLGKVTVSLAGAVQAPWFVLGQTTPQEWKTIRNHPAPWAELQCPGLILSVPSRTIRALDNPVALMEFWQHIADSCNELLTRPLPRKRPERYVADLQISAGYMHSGYPIMTHLDGADLATDLPRLVTQGSWGHFHELGHNHQASDWTFGGTGEVTVNLFSLYLIDRCCGLKAAAHPNVKPEERERKTREYLAAGAPFEKWKADPFLALYLYMQLQEAFGWDAYKRVFAVYEALPEKERPKNDDEKRDQWLVRFSRVVGRNLGPFFTIWGVPTSQAARDSLKDLPEWLPEGFPPR